MGSKVIIHLPIGYLVLSCNVFMVSVFFGYVKYRGVGVGVCPVGGGGYPIRLTDLWLTGEGRAVPCWSLATTKHQNIKC